MRNILKQISRYRFIVLLIVFFILIDNIVMYFGESNFDVATNDYEITKKKHPEEVWDKVFFGSSDVISGYKEDVSESGYINLGMDYAVVTDLWEMIHEKHITIGSELVIGMNLFMLYDDFDTNPTYIWHRGILEPYTYFHRDKLMVLLRNAVNERLETGGISTGWTDKIYYYGSMSDEELLAREERLSKSYYNLPLEDFQENIKTLDKIADWCEENDVRLRILWTPWNPAVEIPDLEMQLVEIVEEWCDKRDIESIDFKNRLDETCFYDSTHINYEYGGYVFTKEVDLWLND